MYRFNRPFPSCLLPLYQNESWCETIHVIQLFRERLSFKRGQDYATRSKLIMGNGGFSLRLLDWTSRCFSVMEGNNTNKRIPPFSFLVAESPWWTPINQNQTLTTHNANRHCRVHFYTFVGEPLSKNTCFLRISKHREESGKCDAQRSIFDEIWGVWIADETLSRVFDIFSIETRTKE